MAARKTKRKKFKRGDFNTEVLAAIVAGAGEPRPKRRTRSPGPGRSVFFENVLSGLGTSQPCVSQ
jgi:hypothetical protein